ncbi:MAG: site-specific DNA-methyltransferase [Nanoarchaeota archaeon]|nr:site-specific DNA-methyltransferase [Nanoarchaeota archaeon]
MLKQVQHDRLILIEKILNHKNIKKQIKEWQELGIINDDFSPSVILTLSGSEGEESDKKTLNPKYQYLPFDTKYFKDLELEILGLFNDGSAPLTTGLDNALDGWLIKSENYQALNTILPKFKEKVQAIYIDPPFNKEQDADYFYSVKYKDASWITLLENRLQVARDLLSDRGSIFVRCDYNGNMYVRLLMNEIFGEGNFRNEIVVNKSIRIKTEGNKFPTWHDSIINFSKYSDNVYFSHITVRREKEEWRSIDTEGESCNVIPQNLLHLFSLKNIKYDEKGNPISMARIILGKEILPRKGRRFPSQEVIIQLEKQDKIRLSENNNPQMLKPSEIYLTDNWSDIYGYSSEWSFPTENSEILLKRVIESTSNGMDSCFRRNDAIQDANNSVIPAQAGIQKNNKRDIILDFFLGSGTTTAVAHKLGRKWIGIEMGEHFYTVVLPRMKKVLAGDKSGISKKVNWQGGGFFKYYELEQYEDTLRKVKYEDADLFDNPHQDPYNQYGFMKDLKLLEALEIDYKKNKVKVDLNRLYDGIDIPETLSNLLGKWIKKITPDYVEFEDGEKINLKDLDYKLIKSLIWW